MVIPVAYSETNTQIASSSLAQTQSQAQEKINLPVYEGIDSVIAPFISSANISKLSNTTPPPVVNNQAKQYANSKKAVASIKANKIIRSVSKTRTLTHQNKPLIKPQLIAVKPKQASNTNSEISVARLEPVTKSALERGRFQSFDTLPARKELNSKLLLQAIANNDSSMVYALIVRGADVNSRDQWGWTALLNATIKGNLEMVNFLLEHGADPNITGKDGRAPIIAASWNGYPAIVASLVNANADVNLANRDGWTALSCAAWNGDIATTRLLLSAAADKSIQTYERQSAIQLAMERGHTAVISLLK